MAVILPKAEALGARIPPEIRQQMQKAAEDTEAFFVSQMMEFMWKGIDTNGLTGGGQGEKVFRSMMLSEYGKEIARGGELGISDMVMRQLLIYQEQANGEIR